MKHRNICFNFSKPAGDSETSVGGTGSVTQLSIAASATSSADSDRETAPDGDVESRASRHCATTAAMSMVGRLERNERQPEFGDSKQMGGGGGHNTKTNKK